MENSMLFQSNSKLHETLKKSIAKSEIYVKKGIKRVKFYSKKTAYFTKTSLKHGE
jgi:hypothetical protein